MASALIGGDPSVTARRAVRVCAHLDLWLCEAGTPPEI
jgi:hypothetical protein